MINQYWGRNSIQEHTLLCAVINSALLWLAHLFHIITFGRTKKKLILDMVAQRIDPYRSSSAWGRSRPVGIYVGFKSTGLKLCVICSPSPNDELKQSRATANTASESESETDSGALYKPYMSRDKKRSAENRHFTLLHLVDTVFHLSHTHSFSSLTEHHSGTLCTTKYTHEGMGEGVGVGVRC